MPSLPFGHKLSFSFHFGLTQSIESGRIEVGWSQTLAGEPGGRDHPSRHREQVFESLQLSQTFVISNE
jgi:hypothetical protein